MPSRKSLRRLALAVVFLAAMVVWAAQPVYNFAGGVQTRATRGLTKRDLKVPTADSSFFTWTYTFMFYLDDDSSAMIQFTFWKYMVVSQPAVIFSFIDKGQKRTFWKLVVKPEELKYVEDPPQLSMGKTSWRGFYPDFYIHLDFPAAEGNPPVKADLHYRCRTPGWRPGEGPVHYGSPTGDWYDLVVMIPWADLDGTMTVGNNQPRKLKGFGYSDHNTQTVFPTSQTSEILALRSFSQNYAINFLEYIAPPDYGKARTTWILIMKGNRILYATDKWDRKLFDLKTEPRRGYQYPTRITVNIVQPDCRLEGTITGVRFIEMLDTMDEVPAFLRGIVARFVTAPAFIRQNAVVQWHLVLPKENIDETFTNKGVLETNVVN